MLPETRCNLNIPDFSDDEPPVLETLQKGKPAAKKELEAKLGRTAGTAERVIQSLIQKDAAAEIEQLESSGGRRPSLFDIRADKGLFPGIHISFGFEQMVLCDLKMHLREQKVLLLPPVREDPETVPEAIAGTFRVFLRRWDRQPEEVPGAGFGIFGPLDREAGGDRQTHGLRPAYHAPDRSSRSRYAPEKAGHPRICGLCLQYGGPSV